jgi:hypothetical protein
MAAKINRNRYRLITLLYVIFVCLSVLNVPFSILDSNIYGIKTLEYQERERLAQVDFANKVIDTHKTELNGDTTLVYISIQNRLHRSYLWVDSLDQVIRTELGKLGTDVYKEFANKNKVEDIFRKDSLVYHFRSEIFSLNSFINAQKYKIDSSIEKLVPVSSFVKTQSGKEMPWEEYLFLHKPTAVNYLQVKRIKLLLLDNEHAYQAAILKTIGYEPAFFSEKENRVFVDKKEEVVINLNDKPLIKNIPQSKPGERELADSKVNPPNTNTTNFTTNNEFDNLYQKIIASLHVDNLYVGIPNTILKNIDAATLRDFSVSVDAGVEMNQAGGAYTLTFRKTGDYVVRFSDKRNGAQKFLFEKKIHASLLPAPVVKLNIENATKDVLSVKELLTLNRLVSTIDVAALQAFPGRINGFRLTRIAKNGDRKVVDNYGEVFRNPIQELIGMLEGGDIIFFDNITIYLADGTTRTPNPILYKIVD